MANEKPLKDAEPTEKQGSDGNDSDKGPDVQVAAKPAAKPTKPRRAVAAGRGKKRALSAIDDSETQDDSGKKDNGSGSAAVDSNRPQFTRSSHQVYPNFPANPQSSAFSRHDVLLSSLRNDSNPRTLPHPFEGIYSLPEIFAATDARRKAFIANIDPRVDTPKKRLEIEFSILRVLQYDTFNMNLRILSDMESRCRTEMELASNTGGAKSFSGHKNGTTVLICIQLYLNNHHKHQSMAKSETVTTLQNLLATAESFFEDTIENSNGADWTLKKNLQHIELQIETTYKRIDHDDSNEYKKWHDECVWGSELSTRNNFNVKLFLYGLEK